MPAKRPGAGSSVPEFPTQALSLASRARSPQRRGSERKTSLPRESDGSVMPLTCLRNAGVGSAGRLRPGGRDQIGRINRSTGRSDGAAGASRGRARIPVSPVPDRRGLPSTDRGRRRRQGRNDRSLPDRPRGPGSLLPEANRRSASPAAARASIPGDGRNASRRPRMSSPRRRRGHRNPSRPAAAGRGRATAPGTWPTDSSQAHPAGDPEQCIAARADCKILQILDPTLWAVRGVVNSSLTTFAGILK